MDIWKVNGMAYQLKDEFVSQETIDALEAYQDARKKQIPWKVKHYGKLHQELYHRDVRAAQQKAERA